MQVRNAFVATVCTVTLLLVALALWVYPSSTDFAPSNPHWNGLMQASREFRMIPLRSLREVPASARGSALVVIPTVAPSPSDLEALARYVEDGGVIFLLDDFGYGNAILARLGVGARLDGQMLVDPLFHFKNGRFPRISDFTPGPTSEGVESLIFNHGTALTDMRGLSVLARSSPASFLDLNQNGRHDAGEPSGPFAVAALGRVGSGSVVVVTDPSILVNSMLEVGSNRQFMRNLFHLAGGDARIYLDSAHLPHAPLDVAKDQLARARGLLAIPLAAWAMAAVALAVPLAMLHRSARSSP